MKTGVSVIVCCYNSAQRIFATLKCLVNQELNEDFQWEIIVVNNASTDDTKKVVEDFRACVPSRERILLVDEPRAGHMNARIKGIEVASYDILIFCDDDNHFDPGYVRLSFELMNKHPEVAVAGGWCKPKLPFYPGKWIESNYGALAIESHPKAPGYVDWVFGAGMVIRKSIFTELRSRSIEMLLVGRKGSKQTSGDDAELCQLARFLGHKVYYSPDLVLDHCISPARLTKWDFIKANYRNVFMVVYFYIMHHLTSQSDATPEKMFKTFYRSRFYYLFYFFPRIFFGKNSFYSFMMFFQNLQLAFWISLRRKSFFRTYNTIKNNLYHDDRM